MQAKQPLYSLEAEFVPQPLAAARAAGPSGWLAAQVRAGEPEPAPGVVHRAAGRRFARGRTTEAGRHPAVHRRQGGHEVPRGRTRGGRQARSERHACGATAKKQLVTLATAALSGNDIDRIVMWAGATLQAPHRAMIAQRGIPPEGVYVGYFAYGSPATRYGLFPGRRIVEVDGIPTPDLDAFLKVVSGPARTVRPSACAPSPGTTRPKSSRLKLDRHYWPTYELRRTGDGWERRDLE